MAGLILWAVVSDIILIFLIYKMYRTRKDILDYTSLIEKWLDDTILGREIRLSDENQDTLPDKMSQNLLRLNHIWDGKEKENQNQKNKLKEMISDISHQTKTPIANIKIYLEMLDDELLSDREREFVENIKEQTVKLDFLLQSMVKMSRMETGIIQIHSEKTNLYETLGNSIAAIVPKAEKKGIRLYVECDEIIKIVHDKKWTEEAVFNILDNAVKYTAGGGKIQITVSVGEIFTKISIKDSGKGIDIGRQAEIFKRFYREPEVHDIEGIGIGLYLSRKIIEMQNGYIEVRSEIGKGSDFQIYLPN